MGMALCGVWNGLGVEMHGPGGFVEGLCPESRCRIDLRIKIF